MATRLQYALRAEKSKNSYHKWKATDNGFSVRHCEGSKRHRQSKKLQEQLKDDKIRGLKEKNERLKHIIQRLEATIDGLSHAFVPSVHADEAPITYDPPATSSVISSERPLKCMMREELYSKPRVFERVVGASIPQFDTLLERTADSFPKFTTKGARRQRPSPKSSKYRPCDVIFITLFFLRVNPTWAAMEAIFGANERTLGHLVCWGIAVLHDAIVSDEIVWPSDEEWKARKHKYKGRVHVEFSDVVALLDGTTVHVPCPTTATAHFMYKKKHAVNFQVV